MSRNKPPKSASGSKGGGFNPLNQGYVPVASGSDPATKGPVRLPQSPKGGSGAAPPRAAKK